MNLLIDGLSETVEISGQDVPINTDFRTGILFEELMTDNSMGDNEKLLTALELYYGNYNFKFEDIQQACEAMTWFYRCGEDKDKTDGSGETSEEKKFFDYEFDADYIYAAFKQAYNIDLARDFLHWWQFKALFKALPEDTQFMKIVGYRTISSSDLSKMTKEQRKHYKKLKEIYKLPESKDKQTLESDLTQLLMNGGNPTSLT